MENCSVESRGGVDCGHGGTGKAERDWSLSVSPQTSEVPPQEHGLGTPVDWVCLGSNTGRGWCQTERPICSPQSLSLCDGSEGAQSVEEGASLTVGIPPPASRDKRAEETDRGEAVIDQSSYEGRRTHARCMHGCHCDGA